MSKEIKKYDENNNCIYVKDSEGYECWYKWKNNNYRIITEKEYKRNTTQHKNKRI